MMPERIEKNAFLCFNNLNGCISGADISMTAEREDGEKRTYTGVDMTDGEEKASNAAFYEKSGELWISAKSRERDKSPIKDILLTIKSHTGSVERLCIGIGVAVFDAHKRSFVPSWESSPLRHELIHISVKEDAAYLSFSMLGVQEEEKKPDNAPPPVTLEKAKEIKEVPLSQELSAVIEADLHILSFYAGDKSFEAQSLLKQASDCITRTQEAKELILRAERLIEECVKQATDAVNEYREHID